MSYEKDCFVCGTNNKDGLRYSYSYDKNKDCSFLEFCPEKYCQSYDGVFHGGLQATVMDSAMVHILKLKNITAVTVRMNLRFRQSVSDEKTIRVEAKITENNKKGFYEVISKIFQDNQIKTECNAIFRKIENIN